MQSTCIVSKSTERNERIHLNLRQNFGTFSFTCFSWNEEAEKSNICISKLWAEDMQLWFARQAVIALNYSWIVVHHNLTTASAPMKLHKKNQMRYTPQEGKMNNKAKRIIQGRDLLLDLQGESNLHLFVCCSYKKWCLLQDTSIRKYCSRRTRVGCFPRECRKSSAAHVDCPSYSQRTGLTQEEVL